MDIATLGYRVDSSGLERGTRALDDNTKAAERTSTATEKLETRYQAIARRGVEYAESMRGANLSDRALAEAAREAAAGIDTKAQIMARAGTEQERMERRVRALHEAEARAAVQTEKAARAHALQELNLKKLLGQIDPTIAKLDRLADMEGTLEKALDMGAIKPEIFTQYQAKIDATRAATLNAGKASDIMTASIGGLNLQAVETQQSIAALGRSLVTGQWGQAQASITSLTARTGLMSAAFSGAGIAIGGVTAAVGGTFYVWNRGAEEARNFERALILSGGAAGTTAARMGDLAARLDDLEGVTRKGAAAAISEVARTGAFTRSQLELVSKAALEWERATGTAVSSTVRAFVDLGEQPIDAIWSLNKQMNFLNQETLDQIESMRKAGNETGAANLAMETYARTISERSPQMTTQLGFVQRAWAAIRDTSAEAMDSLLSIGRDPTSEELSARIAMWQREIDLLPKNDNGTRQLRLSQIAEARAVLRQRGIDEGLAFASAPSAANLVKPKEAREPRKRRERQAPDFFSDAGAELRKLVEIEYRARQSFDAMAATLEGPVQAATYQYGVELTKLRQFAQEGAISTTQLAEAEANLAVRHQENLATLEARANPARRMISDLEFERTLLGVGNVERETMIALRYANIDAMSAEGQELGRLFKLLDEEQKAVETMDALRYSGSSFLQDMASGTKRWSDALTDALDSFRDRLVRIASDRLIEQMLGSFGTSSTGAAGGWMQALGSIFGPRITGFSDGGFTGRGGKHSPAGIVHAGEYVVNAESVRRLGLPFLESLNDAKGYAYGGYVGQLATNERGPEQKIRRLISIPNLTTQEQPCRR